MDVIIPALIISKGDYLQLHRTIRDLPDDITGDVVVVTQGEEVTDELMSDFNNLKILHFDDPINKWGAICEGSKINLASSAKYVALIDADHSVHKESLVLAFEMAGETQFDCLLGDRDKIQLRAADEISPNTRLYVEIFTNTLLTNRLNVAFSPKEIGPDIQCGFRIIRKAIFREMDLSEIGLYGGELAMYYDLVSRNRVIKNVSIKDISSEATGYSVGMIVQNILNLPYFSDISIHDVNMALTVSTSLYRHRLEGLGHAEYEREIEQLLVTYKPAVFSN